MDNNIILDLEAQKQLLEVLEHQYIDHDKFPLVHVLIMLIQVNLKAQNAKT